MPNMKKDKLGLLAGPILEAPSDLNRFKVLNVQELRHLSIE
jgi:hypothetical protein